MANKKKKAAADPGEQLRQISITDFDLTNLEKMFYSVMRDPENKGLKELADYTEKEGTPQRIIFNAYEKGGKLAFALDLAAVAASWKPEEQEALLNLIKNFKEKGELSKEDVLKLLETPEEIEEVIEMTPEQVNSLVTSRPEHINNSLTKLNNAIFKSAIILEEKIEGVQADVTPEDIAKRTDIENKQYSVLAYLEDDKNIKGLENLTEYDGCVHDAIISIIKANKSFVFSARQVAQFILYGTDIVNRASPDQVDEVIKSIRKMRTQQITIDYTQHAELNRLDPGLSCEITNYLLPLKEITLNYNGEKAKAYTLLDTPPLYYYADAVKQISGLPAGLLDIKSTKTRKYKGSKENTVIKFYLIKTLAQIKNIKNSERWKRTRNIDKIIEAVGIDLTNYKKPRDKRKEIIKTITNILDSWKEDGYIKGYEINTGQRKRIESITINP